MTPRKLNKPRNNLEIAKEALDNSVKEIIIVINPSRETADGLEAVGKEDIAYFVSDALKLKNKDKIEAFLFR